MFALSCVRYNSRVMVVNIRDGYIEPEAHGGST